MTALSEGGAPSLHTLRSLAVVLDFDSKNIFHINTACSIHTLTAQIYFQFRLCKLKLEACPGEDFGTQNFPCIQVRKIKTSNHTHTKLNCTDTDIQSTLQESNIDRERERDGRSGAKERASYSCSRENSSVCGASFQKRSTESTRDTP